MYVYHVYVCLSVCIHVHLFEAHRGQKRIPDSLELELKMIVTNQEAVLRIELGFSKRATGAHDHWVIYSAPYVNNVLNFPDDTICI